MNRLGKIALAGAMIGFGALLVEMFYFDAANLFYFLPVWFIYTIIFAWYIKKKTAEQKEQQEKEMAVKAQTGILPDPSLYPYREYYYSKNVSISLFIAYILMTGCFSFAVTLDDSLLYRFFMGLAVALCLFFLWYNYKKWLVPANRNIPALSIDEKQLDLKNGYTPILWGEIDSIIIRGNVIGIKLTSLDEYLDKQSTKKKVSGLKFYRRFYGYNFGISPIIIRDSDLDTTITDYFDRFRSYPGVT